MKKTSFRFFTFVLFLTLLVLETGALAAKAQEESLLSGQEMMKEDTTKENQGHQRKEIRKQIQEKRRILREKIISKKKELKEKLTVVKDERKRKIMEKIDERMDALNQKMTDHFLLVLDKLEDVLERIKQRAEQAEKERGWNVAVVRQKIDEATRAITLAREAVREQAGKTYTPEVESEKEAKQSIREIRQALHGDLALVKKQIKTAKKAIQEAVKALAQQALKHTPQPRASLSPLSSPSALPSESPISSPFPEEPIATPILNL